MAKVSVRGGDKFSAALQKIAGRLGKGSVVQMGFLKGAKYPDGTQVAAVAAFQDFGTRTIPPRPFFRNMIAKHKSDWPKEIAKILKATNYDGKRTLALQGKNMENQLRQSIRETNSPPLAPSTVKAKGSAKPLIRSGVMINSVDSQVID